jgi:DNA repair photolyase
MNATAQATLPLLPVLPAPRGGRAGLGRGVRRIATAPSGVEYAELDVREILNRPLGGRTPYRWTINPYRGCEMGCVHCPSRYTHGFLGLERWRDFETRIFVKTDAAAALGRRLRTSALAGQPIAIGTAADPYQPAEERCGITRRLLETLLDADGLSLTLLTRSPLVLRDLDLLARLDRRHAVTVQFKLPAVDPVLLARLDPGAPPAEARLGAVERLAAEGIATAVAVAPLAPGINDREETLGPLLGAARRAGAYDVAASPLTLSPATRARFAPWLAREMPRLVPTYRRLYGRRNELRQVDRNRLSSTFRRLRLELGFPQPRPGRG